MRPTKSLKILLSAALSLALLIPFIVAGCGEESPAASTQPVSTAKPATTLKPLTKEYVTDLAGQRIGGAQLVREVSITGADSQKTVSIHVDRPEVCHDGAVVGTAATFAQKMMALLFKYPEVTRVDISMYGLEEGVVSDDVALKVTVDAATGRSIDWFQFTDLNMPTYAAEYYVHPKIKANYDAEGGDPNGPKSQTQTQAAPAT